MIRRRIFHVPRVKNPVPTEMTVDDLLASLTGLWYRCLIDHHKDRDCHWTIAKVWSYGDKPKYRLEHYGYIGEQVIEDFGTYREAAEFMAKTLTRMIMQECDYYLKDPEWKEEWPKMRDILAGLNAAWPEPENSPFNRRNNS